MGKWNEVVNETMTYTLYLNEEHFGSFLIHGFGADSDSDLNWNYVTFGECKRLELARCLDQA